MKKIFNNKKINLITFYIIGIVVILFGFSYIKTEVQNFSFQEGTSTPNIDFPTNYDQSLSVKLADFEISIRPLGAKPVEAVVENNIVKYIDAYQNTDVIQIKSSDNIKE